MRTVILGIGNVAHSLVSSIKQNEYSQIEIAGVYGRDARKLSEFASRFYVRPAAEISAIPLDADLYIICTADSGIADTARMLREIGISGTVVHTSGSTDISVLREQFPHCGVIYPLQTFSKSRIVDFRDVPLYLEHSSQEAEATIAQFAHTISENVSQMSSLQRKTMHMSAVFASNFVNHSIAAAQALLHESGLDKRMLDPLISETVGKALSNDPVLSQTGPAVRHDTAIMAMHSQMLEGKPTLKEIYGLMSQSIQQFKEKYKNGISG